jgi:hypothetical protein
MFNLSTPPPMQTLETIIAELKNLQNTWCLEPAQYMQYAHRAFAAANWSFPTSSETESREHRTLFEISALGPALRDLRNFPLELAYRGAPPKALSHFLSALDIPKTAIHHTACGIMAVWYSHATAIHRTYAAQLQKLEAAAKEKPRTTNPLLPSTPEDISVAIPPLSPKTESPPATQEPLPLPHSFLTERTKPSITARKRRAEISELFSAAVTTASEELQRQPQEPTREQAEIVSNDLTSACYGLCRGPKIDLSCDSNKSYCFQPCGHVRKELISVCPACHNCQVNLAVPIGPSTYSVPQLLHTHCRCSQFGAQKHNKETALAVKHLPRFRRNPRLRLGKGKPTDAAIVKNRAERFAADLAQRPITNPLARPPDPASALMHKFLRKAFPTPQEQDSGATATEYIGQVTRIIRPLPGDPIQDILYHVKYWDNDTEDLTETELRPLIARFEYFKTHPEEDTGPRLPPLTRTHSTVADPPPMGCPENPGVEESKEEPPEAPNNVVVRRRPTKRSLPPEIGPFLRTTIQLAKRTRIIGPPSPNNAPPANTVDTTPTNQTQVPAPLLDVLLPAPPPPVWPIFNATKRKRPMPETVASEKRPRPNPPDEPS